MKKEQYKRKPGDFEIRILADGRLVMIAPDEQLIEIAKTIDSAKKNHAKETCDNARVEKTDNT